MTADDEVMRFLGGVVDRSQTWRMMSLFAGHWQLRGFGTWVVQRRADEAVLGRAGLWQPEGWPGIEVGWVFARSAWGHGYATESARAAVDWAWANLRCDRLISLIADENERSINVARRLGMSAGGRHEHPSLQATVYELRR